MSSPATKLAVLLLFTSAALIAYRVAWLGYPLFPTALGETWRISFEAGLEATSDGIEVELGLPQDSGGRRILSEEISSGLLRLDLVREAPNRIGKWSGPIRGPAFVAYSARILVQAAVNDGDQAAELPPYPADFVPAERFLAERLVGKWLDLPLPQRLAAVIEALYGNWEKANPAQQDLEAWLTAQDRHDWTALALLLLRAAQIPARSAHGLRLVTHTLTEQPLTWLQAWNGKRWVNLRLATGLRYEDPQSLVPLSFDRPAFTVVSGAAFRTRWGVRREVTSTWLLHFERVQKSRNWLDRLSLFNLPPEFQATFRVLLLVPLGALLVCVFRNMVGFPVFGIFMPVLMALAFRSTGLIYGLGIFAFVILVGYASRRALDRLHLLLVPRLSVMLSLVIFCIVAFAGIGNLYDLRQFMAVGLLPIVILTMTIERFFIITEESGLGEAAKTALGSAAVAAMTYGIILWEPLQLTFFVYPELIFAVTALQVLLGRYTGFRLSELHRFRALR